MNIQKVRKIFTVLMLIATISLALSMVLSGSVLAAPTAGAAGAPTSGGLAIPDVNSGTTPGALTGTTQNVLTIVAYLCYTAAVILLIMLGIKYMTQAPDGKAEIKKMAITYVIGAILVFAAGLVLQVLSSIFNESITTG